MQEPSAPCRIVTAWHLCCWKDEEGGAQQCHMLFSIYHSATAWHLCCWKDEEGGAQ